MSFAISMHMPDQAPVARSLLKYGASPGNAAIRSTLVRLTRSIVDSPGGVCASASRASRAAAPAVAAAPARTCRSTPRCSGSRPPEALVMQSVQLVIPGRRTAASPESMNTGLWNMDSGLCPLGSPGMTIYGGTGHMRPA